jgi:hypothetical protein
VSRRTGFTGTQHLIPIRRCSLLILTQVKRKGKIRPKTGHEDPEEQRYSSTLSLTSSLDKERWSTPSSGRFILWEDPVPTVQEAGWAPERVQKISPPTGFRSPDLKFLSKSLYQLRRPQSTLISTKDSYLRQIPYWFLSAT